MFASGAHAVSFRECNSEWRSRPQVCAPMLCRTRLNRYMSEKLQVINTPMASFVRKLQGEYLCPGSALDSDTFDWDRSRGGDFRCITQALYIIAKWPSSAAIGAITQLEKWLHNPTTKPYARGGKVKKESDPSQDLSNDAAFLDRIHATLHAFSKLVGDTSLHPLFLKPEWRISPIEFVMMCLLVSVTKDTLSPQGLAMRIGEMRQRVRGEHLDIRMNARVAKTMFDFIRESADAERTSIGVKRKREEEEVEIPGTQDKEPRTDAPGEAARSQTSAVIPPPRPDRLLAVREAKKAIAPPRVTPPKPPTTPMVLR